MASVRNLLKAVETHTSLLKDRTNRWYAAESKEMERQVAASVHKEARDVIAIPGAQGLTCVETDDEEAVGDVAHEPSPVLANGEKINSSLWYNHDTLFNYNASKELEEIELKYKRLNSLAGVVRDWLRTEQERLQQRLRLDGATNENQEAVKCYVNTDFEDIASRTSVSR